MRAPAPTPHPPARGWPAGERERCCPRRRSPAREAGGQKQVWGDRGWDGEGMVPWEVVASPEDAPHPGPPGAGGRSGDKAAARMRGRTRRSLLRGLGGKKCIRISIPTSPEPPEPHPQPSSPTTVLPPRSFPPRWSAGEGWGPAARAASSTPAASPTTSLLHPPLLSSTRQGSCLLVIFFGRVGGQEKR